VRTRALLGGLAALVVACATSTVHTPTPAERRLELLQPTAGAQDPVPALVAALEDDSPVVRRTAARLLGTCGPAGATALAATQRNTDMLVRRTGLVGLCRLGGEGAVTAAGNALADSNAMVRLVAVQYLAALQPRSDAVAALLDRACSDGSEKVRTIASRATWPFYRDGASIRDRQNTDRDIAVAQTLPLPAEGWRFRLDPQRDGHRRGWYETDFDDGGWDAIAIEQAWQQAGYEYIGVTWYRRAIELPAAPEHLAVDLHFGGVDESAWVWLNGEYVGQHDVGPSGWNQPFRLDITAAARWGQANQLTVRAMNTAHAGGIWKPVEIEVLQ